MTKDEVAKLREKPGYQFYDKKFTGDSDEDDWGWESAYDLAIQKLIEKDEEIKLLRDLQRSLNDRITRYTFGKF
jgi:hypothetical protein